MQDKKVSVRFGLSLLSVAILVPLVSNVNHFTKVSKEQIKSQTLQADGAPIPPLPPVITATLPFSSMHELPVYSFNSPHTRRRRT